MNLRQWYSEWHSKPQHILVHWAFFLAIVFIVGTQLIATIEKYYDISFNKGRAQVEYFVAPNGTAVGDGSSSNPWDLQTALNGANGVIQPGSIINLRGGTYTGRYTSTLNGTSSAPIVVRSYPGEWAKVDGNHKVTLATNMSSAAPWTTSTIQVSDASGINIFPNDGPSLKIGTETVSVYIKSGGVLTVTRGHNGSCPSGTCPAHSIGEAVYLTSRSVLKITGTYTSFENFEVMSSNTGRVSQIPGSNMQNDIVNGSGIDDYGVGNKVINLIIHDNNGQGLGTWSQASNSEYYGNVIYNNGLDAPDRPHGHGIYAQNQTGSKHFINNIALHNFYLILQQYGSDQSFSNNFYWEGNTFYSPGADGVLFGGGAPMNNLNITNNNFYGLNPRVGYSNPYNNGIKISGNYFGKSHLAIILSKNVTINNNTTYDPVEGYNLSLRLDAQPSNPLGDYSIDNNTYYAANGSGVGADMLVYPYSVSPTGCPYYWFNHQVSGFGYCGQQQGWQEDLGYDLHSTRVTTPPTGSKVMLQTNKYDPSRANVIIYNWDKSSTVSVNVSSLNWLNGTDYELRNTLDYFGDVIKGTYNGSGSITVPMTNHTVALPVGYNQALGPNTFPEFGAFVLIRSTPEQIQELPPPPLPEPPPPPTSDTTPPSTPGRPSVSSSNYAEVKLTWRASTDNVKVAGYQVYRNGALLGTTALSSYSDNTVSPSTAYSYYVKAYDAAGNYSAASSTRTLTVPAPKAAYISNISVSQPSKGADIKISWKTSLGTDSTLSFGTTSTNLDRSLTTSGAANAVQSVTIPGSTYPSLTKVYYRIKASLPSPYANYTTTSYLRSFTTK